ncbi:uncharacterized protein LOC124279634 [Haliotis rubra]|uniref:uncharacterized protein LOC124279634 n=1 Tax=Haliotis rubra TaxID=36100 RepID=UPI001EE52C93|nr:uncharacterized protein LOC124279634 [Haliotis rubra]
MRNTPQEDDCSLKTKNDRAAADVYHLFHVGETEKLFNEAFREHATTSTNCKGDLVMDIEHEQQWGLNWTERLKCTNCGYLSKHHKLYKEVEVAAAKKGRRSSTANTGLQIGLSKCPMGSESFRVLCMSADIPPPIQFRHAESCKQSL